MNSSLFSLVDLTIEVGTTHVVLASRKKGFFLREENRIALEEIPQAKGAPLVRVAAIGHRAAAFEGRPGIRVVEPVDHGRLVDRMALDRLLKAMVAPTRGRLEAAGLSRGTGALLVPPGMPLEQQLQLLELTGSLAKGNVELIEVPVAAARGSGLDTSSPKGHMVVDLGGGKTCMGVITMDGLATALTQPYGGVDLDNAIARHLEKRYAMRVSPLQAREIKHTLGTAYPPAKPGRLLVEAPALRGGSNKRITLFDQEIRDVILDGLEPVVLSLQKGFEAVPPELCGDLVDSAVVLVGGGALLQGITEYLTERINVPFVVAEDPLNAAFRGAQEILLGGGGGFLARPQTTGQQRF